MACVAFANNTFTFNIISWVFAIQVVCVRKPSDLTSMTFPPLEQITMGYNEHVSLLKEKAELVTGIVLMQGLKRLYIFIIMDLLKKEHVQYELQKQPDCDKLGRIKLTVSYS